MGDDVGAVEERFAPHERPTTMRVVPVVVVLAIVPLLGGCGDEASPREKTEDSGVSGRVLLGPQCPVEVEGQPCDDQPAAGVEVTVGEQLPGEAYAMGTVVARATTDADGQFRVAVPPGDYVVTATAGMACELMDVHVVSGQYVVRDVPCDTGIR